MISLVAHMDDLASAIIMINDLGNSYIDVVGSTYLT